MSNKDHPVFGNDDEPGVVPGPRAAADARESASGADAARSASMAFEGSHKQSADINQEELQALLTGLAAKGATREDSINALNSKRSYDQSQSFDLMTLQGDMNHRQNLNQLSIQALQNAVETANMVGKQAVRHGDLAIDRQWNIDEQAMITKSILRSGTYKDAVAGAVAAAVAAALADLEEK